MEKVTFKFIEKKSIWFFFSSTIILIGLMIASFKTINQSFPFNLGIDFTGGSTFLLELRDYTITAENKPTVIKDLRSLLIKNNIKKSTIQITSQNYVSIKTIFLTTDDRKTILKLLTETFGKVELLEADIIGPSIGQELKKQAIWMILAVSFVLLAYITIRFEFYYGVAAILALIHDILIVLSFSIITQIEVNTAFVAAVLTILGYSINDTIVIFDRIRENMPKIKHLPLANILNISIQKTLGRSIHTSLTTLVVCLCLLL